MKQLLAQIRAAGLATLVLAGVCGGLYPLVVFGIGQLLFHDQANGSLIVDSSGAIRGSTLLGQGFTGATYFHPRPSAAGNGYDATRSGGSNLGPTSQKLNDAIRDRIVVYRNENAMTETDPVPADAVTASGSGLDPHISVGNAELQAPRVARARHLSLTHVLQLTRAHTQAPDLRVLGRARVNVLELNLALDELAETRKGSAP